MSYRDAGGGGQGEHVPPQIFGRCGVSVGIGVKYDEKLAVRRPQTSWRLTNLTLFLKSAFLRLRPC